MVSTISGVSVCGTREIDMHQPSAPAAITSTATSPIVSTVSIRIGQSCFTSSVR